jgi:hypothetical protein
MVRTGSIRKIEDAFNMAKQEFGEVTPLLKKQIERIFARGKKQEPGTKKQKEGEVVPFKTSKDQDEGITFSVPEKGIFNQKTSIDEVTEMLTKNPFRTGGGLDQVTGITRALARRILDKKGIEIGKKDPIDAFTDTFGEAIGDVKNLAEEMIEIDARGGGMKNMDEMLEIEGLFDIEIPKNPSKGLTNKEMLDLMEETEQEDILKKFDPEDREPNAMGGINRVGFARGKIKLAQFLAGKGKDLVKEIKKSVDNIFTTGDKKYDADVVVDDMVERLGIDRDVVDQTDILDAYDEAYKMLSKEGIDPKDTILPEGAMDEIESTGQLISKQLKRKRIAENIKSDLFENLTDEQAAIIDKYGDKIDEDLLKNIVLDPDPSNQAAAVATLDEVETMMGKGMSTDEIMSALQSTPRRKQAEGGLSYLMGM